MALAAVPAVYAEVDAPTLPGWDSENGRAGIALAGKAVTFSSPVIAEIDGNTQNGKEVAVGGSDGRLYAYHADGTPLWVVNMPTGRCAAIPGPVRIFSSPAVGALFGDGIQYVVVGYGNIGSTGCNGGVVAVRGPDGAMIWDFSLLKFARQQHFSERYHGVFATPALADVDGDGRLEIGFGALDRKVYLLNADASVRWYYIAADTVFSSPAFANIDSDPALEMIIGTDISANKHLRPPTKNGGYVYAFKTAPRRKLQIGFRDPSAYLWQATFDQVIQSSPVVADVLPSSPGREIVVASGCFFPQSSPMKTGRWVKILRPSDGAVIQTLNSPGCSQSSVAVGDLDGDGTLEVVATVSGHRSVGGDGYSRVVAWKPASSEPIWTTTPRSRGGQDPYGGLFMSPVIADIDGNGSLEVLAANGAAVHVFDGRNGASLTCQNRSCATPTLIVQGALRGTPAVGDLNGDGVLDLVIGGGSSRGKLYGWTGLGGLLGSSVGSYAPYTAPWPMARGDQQRDGRL